MRRKVIRCTLALLVLLVAARSSSALTGPQLQALRADIAGDAELSALPNTPDDNQRIADAYNALASPVFYVWRTRVSEVEYTTGTGVDAANGNANTSWSWPAYIARSPGEQNGWGRMFATAWVDPSSNNVRQGFGDVFSGSQNNAPAQRNHLNVMSIRAATRAEKLLANGTGTFASPARLRFEGNLTYQVIEQARNP